MKLNNAGFYTDTIKNYKFLGHWYSPYHGVTGSYKIGVKGILSFCVPYYSVAFMEQMGQLKLSSRHVFFVVLKPSWVQKLNRVNNEYGTNYKMRMFLTASALAHLLSEIIKLKHQEKAIYKRVNSIPRLFQLLAELKEKMFDNIVKITNPNEKLILKWIE